MKKLKRENKLFKNIAIIVLACIILFIIKNVYFHKTPIIEGFGKDFSDYDEMAVKLKIQKFTNDTIKNTFNEFVQIYKQKLQSKNDNDTTKKKKKKECIRYNGGRGKKIG